jgi:hypothetical protein
MRVKLERRGEMNSKITYRVRDSRNRMFVNKIGIMRVGVPEMENF